VLSEGTLAPDFTVPDQDDVEGVIRKAYEVGDVNTFAATVLDDLRALQS
jgi:hypothetical protein